MNILLAITLLLPQAVEAQTDWVGGPGILGPVTTWGSAFYQSDSINYNVSGQISLVGTAMPGGWIKHIIQTASYIDGRNGIYPADFDGDGDLDLAAWASVRDSVRIFKNQMVETGNVNYIYQTRYAIPGDFGYGLIWCGDFDNDNDPDIVVPTTPGPVWFENTGSFNFTFHAIGSTNYDRTSCDVGDVDNDGDMDIVIYGSTSNKLDLWRNNGSMSFTRENINYTGNWWRVNLGDLNNDNHLDIFNSGDVYINSSGTFSSTPSWTVPGADDIDGISIRDFNNDNKKDLLIGFQWASTPEMAWYENDGSGTNYTKHTICTGTDAYNHSDACIGEDIDLDGIPDVVGVYNKVGFFRQYPLNTFTLNEIDDSFPDAHWCFVANLDYKPGGSDFDMDILATREGGQFAWWENVIDVQFAVYGYLESSILQKTDALSWLKLHWNGARPTGTICKLWVRSGADASSIQTNPWQGPFDVPVGPPNGEFDISGVTTPGHHYFQYKVEMGCGTVNESPVLYEVAVEYEVQPGAGHDVGVLEILEPLGTITADSTVIPTAVVKNFGGFYEEFYVFFNIGCAYSDFRCVRLGAGEIDTVTFDSWLAVAGYYNEDAATYLETDENPDNDAVDEWLTVAPSMADAVRGYTVPIKFELFKPYPNPTSNNLMISYALPQPSPAEFMIYDINGRVVKRLISETKAPGYYRVNTDCRELGSGVYIVKMKADKFEARTKFIVTN
ncbi:MAG: T9SS type A sorting domain-containing protein [candidate division WOR-3 bacterium]|nr:T9SS type A sorting domain-containing protein [candidate division WOR-3 bacterium]